MRGREGGGILKHRQCTYGAMPQMKVKILCNYMMRAKAFKQAKYFTKSCNMEKSWKML